MFIRVGIILVIVRVSENFFWLQRTVWSPKYFFHSFIHFKISASARHARHVRFSDALLIVPHQKNWCLWCHCHLGRVRNQLSAYRWEYCIIVVDVNGNPPCLCASSSDLAVITTPRAINIRGILCSFAGTPLIYSMEYLLADSLHYIP